MLRAGLTGGLGSGKTTIADIFRSLGAQVIEADAIGRELMSPGHDLYKAIVDLFGSDVVRADGALDRTLLAELAFRQDRLGELNALVHPPVIAAQQKWAEEIFAKDPTGVAIVESALIFEADRQGSAPGWRQRFDRVILVTAPLELRVTRYVDRLAQLPGAPTRAQIELEARRRIAAQIPDSEKIPFVDYVIHNDGLIVETRREIERIYAHLALASRSGVQK